MPNSRKAWTVEDELNFIKNIGTYSEAGQEFNRKLLRSKYLRTLKLRARWDNNIKPEIHKIYDAAGYL